MSSAIRFDDFELDVNTYQLRHAGASIRLERIPMEMLMLLSENPGRLVLRSELAERIWGGGHLEDDYAINTAVRKLRAALADNAENPRFIETVRGKGYRFVGAERTPARPVEAESTAPGRTILVVLPIENLSEPPLEPYLNDGLTEELITRLGTLSAAGFGVIGRAGAMECQRRGLTPPEIGRELGADLVLEGSVRRQPQRVRISVRLLQAGSQVQIWARSYDCDPDDLLAWQRDVARRIVRELSAAANPGAGQAEKSRNRRGALRKLLVCAGCRKKLAPPVRARNRRRRLSIAGCQSRPLAPSLIS